MLMLNKASVATLCLLALVTFNTACKKDSTSNAPRKLKSYTEDVSALGVGHTVETFNITYDAQGRITSVVSTTKPGHKLVYNYINSDQFTFDRIEDDKVTLHSTYYINAEVSKIDSVYQYNIRKDTLSVKYLYNSDGQIIKEKEYLHSYLIPSPVWVNTVKYQYDLQGTLTKKSDDYYETSYRYDADYKNTVQLEPFYFPVQEQLPTHTYTQRFGTLITIVHTYTFDGDKRLISEKAVSSDGITTIRNYTYL
ncbi:hypothetical protein A3860_13605 [Niastella vici]|uniref:DUF4595 domain-containing protein n=2 Tax=Niastella vici TaxID=1703345 RepID=A0A1V9G7R7_9BACT|nr:hypothetical protein A3860_13605 [Niastella vici]